MSQSKRNVERSGGPSVSRHACGKMQEQAATGRPAGMTKPFRTPEGRGGCGQCPVSAAWRLPRRNLIRCLAARCAGTMFLFRVKDGARDGPGLQAGQVEHQRLMLGHPTCRAGIAWVCWGAGCALSRVTSIKGTTVLLLPLQHSAQLRPACTACKNLHVSCLASVAAFQGAYTHQRQGRTCAGPRARGLWRPGRRRHRRRPPAAAGSRRTARPRSFPAASAGRLLRPAAPWVKQGIVMCMSVWERHSVYSQTSSNPTQLGQGVLSDHLSPCPASSIWQEGAMASLGSGAVLSSAAATLCGSCCPLA